MRFAMEVAATVVDRLGKIAAEKRALSDEDSGLKAALIDGAGDWMTVSARFTGSAYEALVYPKTTKVVDKDAVIEYLATVLCLNPVELGAILAEHTKSVVVPAVKIGAIKKEV